MNKKEFTQQMGNWHKHTRSCVKSKSQTLAFSVFIGLLIVYITLFFLSSGLLFFVLIIPLLMRSFYVLARGDWYDLASQLGLKCWQCQTVFHRDKSIQQVLESNICPGCHKAVYDITQEDSA
jgi:hypothetical protein